MEDKGLNHTRVIIQKPFWEKDELTNQRTEAWADYRFCRGHFVYGKGGEDYQEPVFIGMKSATVMVRENTSKPITSEMRVITQKRTWSIKGVSPAIQGRVSYVLLSLELIENLVNDGSSDSRY